MLNRRKFIRNIVLATGGTLALPQFACNSRREGEIKFAICTDVHRDIMHDADERLKHFIAEAQKNEVGFIINLGDFCHPLKKNQPFIDIWDSFPGKKYHVLGNHDMDMGTKMDFMTFTGMKRPYYSFDHGLFHFVVLDINNLRIMGRYVDYANGNFYRDKKERAHVDPKQLEWLRRDLKRTKRTTIIFSHQSLEHPNACQNQEEVRAVLEEANREAGYHKVVAAFSGHDHTDYAREINGIQYIQVNSMSNQWVGEQYQCPERFPESVNQEKPLLKFTAPYEDPLYATVTLAKGYLGIEGVQSSFIPPTPEELGIPANLHDLPLTAKITSREFEW